MPPATCVGSILCPYGSAPIELTLSQDKLNPECRELVCSTPWSSFAINLIYPGLINPNFVERDIFDCTILYFLTDMAEILSKKEIGDRAIYYIHYDDCEYQITFKSRCAR